MVGEKLTADDCFTTWTSKYLVYRNTTGDYFDPQPVNSLYDHRPIVPAAIYSEMKESERSATSTTRYS